MKVAILGARGFVGRNLTLHLSNRHEVIPVTRETLDMLDPIAVRGFLKEHIFDVVINCAAVM